MFDGDDLIERKGARLVKVGPGNEPYRCRRHINPVQLKTRFKSRRRRLGLETFDDQLQRVGIAVDVNFYFIYPVTFVDRGGIEKGDHKDG